MSINMEDSGAVDYADFRQQHAVVQIGRDTNGSQNPNIKAATKIEPLSGVGGLQNNEVAELVHLKVLAQIEYEQESADQDVGSASEHRGVIGINLPAKNSAFPQSVSNQIETDIFDDDGGAEFSNAATLTDNKYLDQYMVRGAPAFDDQVNGTGGGEGTGSYHNSIHYRNLTGRGPVLDQNDDITALQALNISDSVITESAQLRLSMVWDVAETSDAGRQFSLP